MLKDTEKDTKIDEKDRKILEILSKNSRTTLKEIGKKVGLSIDSTKARIDKMKASGIITGFTIQVDIEKLGLPLGAHIYIKLKNITDENLDEFITYLKNYDRVIDLMSVLGDYDIFTVILAKDTVELNQIKTKIRKRFTDIIESWNEVLVTEVHKFEQYSY